MEELDKHDKNIIKMLLENSEMSLRDIGKHTGIMSPSAISRRIERMRKQRIIKKNTIQIDYEILGFGFVTITFVKARYSPGYKDIVAKKIMSIKGIVSIYFLLGDIDFVTVTVSSSKEEYAKILDELTNIEEIERTDSRTVLKTYREYDLGSIFSDKKQ